MALEYLGIKESNGQYKAMPCMRPCVIVSHVRIGAALRIVTRPAKAQEILFDGGSGSSSDAASGSRVHMEESRVSELGAGASLGYRWKSSAGENMSKAFAS